MEFHDQLVIDKLLVNLVFFLFLYDFMNKLWMCDSECVDEDHDEGSKEKEFFVDFLVQKIEFDSCQAKNFCHYPTKWEPPNLRSHKSKMWGPQSEIQNLSLLIE